MFYQKSWEGCIREAMKCIESRIYTELSELSCEMYWSKEPLPFEKRTEGVKRQLTKGQTWGDLFDCGWFHFTGKLPENASVEETVIRIDISGEGLMVDGSGTPVIGLTNVHCIFDRYWGSSAKREIPAKLCTADGVNIDIWVDGGCNDIVGGYSDNGVLAMANVSFINELAFGLYYDFEVLMGVWETLDRNSAFAKRLFTVMKDAISVFIDYTDEEMIRAKNILKPALEAKSGFEPVTLIAVGHAHLDLAWLWPERETIRKGARTFATALRMEDRYPDYIFGASQAQLYQWIKDYYPGLFEEIRKRVSEGRWDIQGAMWVEADTNLSGGEALIRQMSYGKEFFKREFDKDIKVLWLPDVFGYSAALPQILKKCGVDYFFTNKLSMNANRIPHHTFHWKGIDGSSVLVHMTPGDDYASKVLPRQLKYTRDNYFEAGICDEALLLFGRSDGGGGAGREHLERLTRLKNMASLPPLKTGTVEPFYEKLAENSHKYATWNGELYFEWHHGTLTTQAKTKKGNRFAENAVRACEMLCALASREKGFEYPKNDLERIWKRILFLQFHDVLPGSSIKRVYDEAYEEYPKILEELKEISYKAASALGLSSLNLTSVHNYGYQKADGKWCKVSAGPFSSAKYSECDAKLEAFENEIYSFSFTEDGGFSSIYDKEKGRELLRSGSIGNRFAVYPDDADAWELPVGYRSRACEYFTLTSREFIFDGPKAICRSEYKYGNSVILQDMVIFAGDREIRFETKVDWKETGKMLRTGFEIDVNTTQANCGIQFGQLARPTHINTSWENEKFEVCAPRYVDLCESDYGVSMMSDCKYGYCVQENRLDICLLRSSMWPGKDADKGEHEFTYTLYAHKGDTASGGVVERSERLNRPVCFFGGSEELERYIDISAPSVLVEAFKRAEDGEGYILRIYESLGREVDATVRVKDMVCCELSDMLENKISGIAVEDGAAELRIKPYEIVTLRIK